MLPTGSGESREGDCSGGGRGREGARGWRGAERAAQQVERGGKRMKPLKIKAKNRNASQECV